MGLRWLIAQAVGKQAFGCVSGDTKWAQGWIISSCVYIIIALPCPLKPLPGRLIDPDFNEITINAITRKRTQRERLSPISCSCTSERTVRQENRFSVELRCQMPTPSCLNPGTPWDSLGVATRKMKSSYGPIFFQISYINPSLHP